MFKDRLIKYKELSSCSLILVNKFMVVAKLETVGPGRDAVWPVVGSVEPKCTYSL